MNETELLKAIGDIKDEYVEEAAGRIGARAGSGGRVRMYGRRTFVLAGAAAAVFVALLSVKIYRAQLSKGTMSETATMQPAAPDAAAGAAAPAAGDDMEKSDYEPDHKGAAGAGEMSDAAYEAVTESEEMPPAVEEKHKTNGVDPDLGSYGFRSAEESNATSGAEAAADEDTYVMQDESESAESTAQSEAAALRKVSRKEAEEFLGRDFLLPEGAADIVYQLSDAGGVVQADCIVEGAGYTVRIKAAEAFEDISAGAMTDGGEELDISGHKGVLYRRAHGGYVTWYDGDTHLVYGVETSADDADRLISIARSMRLQP